LPVCEGFYGFTLSQPFSTVDSAAAQNAAHKKLPAYKINIDLDLVLDKQSQV